MVLALVFDAETPFSTIRTQASHLVHSLSTSPAEDGNADEDGDEEVPTTSLSDILSDVPSPNPPQRIPPVTSMEFPYESSQTGPAIEAGRLSYEPQPAGAMAFTDQAEVDEQALADGQVDESLAATRQSRSRRKTELAPDQLAETRQASIPEPTHKIVLEPVSPSVYNLSYDCLLIPRFLQHYLTVEMADHLSDWIQQTCVAYGWRLEYISVRPDYLQWIVNVPPATSPGYVMRMLRKHTSEKIFNEFPRYKKENPSGDFWAPGYLIMGGSQPAPAQLIKDFITQTRQRQGITPAPR
jgi:REP element-mobilizing transposase RayT